MVGYGVPGRDLVMARMGHSRAAPPQPIPRLVAPSLPRLSPRARAVVRLRRARVRVRGIY